MVETVLAVLVITFLFLVLFKLAHMLMGAINSVVMAAGVASRPT